MEGHWHEGVASARVGQQGEVDVEPQGVPGTTPQTKATTTTTTTTANKTCQQQQQQQQQQPTKHVNSNSNSNSNSNQNTYGGAGFTIAHASTHVTQWGYPQGGVHTRARVPQGTCPTNTKRSGRVQLAKKVRGCDGCTQTDERTHWINPTTTDRQMTLQGRGRTAKKMAHSDSSVTNTGVTRAVHLMLGTMNDEGGVWQRGGGAAQVRCRRGCGAGGGGRGQGRPLKNVTFAARPTAASCTDLPAHPPYPFHSRGRSRQKRQGKSETTSEQSNVAQKW